jgi:hypothetical protein
VTDDSPSYPEWLRWAGWILASAAAVAYIVVDVVGSAGEKRSLDAARVAPPEHTGDRPSQSAVAQPERAEPVAPHEPPPSTAAGNSDASGGRRSVS